MKNIYQLLFLGIILFPSLLVAQEKIYFDEDWEQCSEEDAYYYRIATKKDNGFEIKDYYLASNTIQFEAFSTKKEEPFHFDGKVTWFYENGQMQSNYFYKDNLLEGAYAKFYSNGNVHEGGVYKNGKGNGLFYQLDIFGDTIEIIGLKDGEYYGASKQFEDGKLKLSATFNGNKIEGELISVIGNTRTSCFVHDQLFDGDYLKIDTETNDTLEYGYFDKGIAQHFYTRKNDGLNLFELTMTLKNGIEQWTLVKNSKLIGKVNYKEAKPINQLQLFDAESGQLYSTVDFSQTNCSYNYLQGLKDNSFYIYLDKRFKIYGFDDFYDCNVEEKIILEDKAHPIYDENEEIEIVFEEEYDSEYYDSFPIDYVDAANNAQFHEKNNCKLIDETNATYQCVKMINNIEFVVYTSNNEFVLRKLQREHSLSDNQIVFFYETIESKKYYSNDEIDDERFYGFSISSVLQKDILKDDENYYSIIHQLEHNIFSVESFSGMQAGWALDDCLSIDY